MNLLRGHVVWKDRLRNLRPRRRIPATVARVRQKRCCGATASGKGDVCNALPPEEFSLYWKEATTILSTCVFLEWVGSGTRVTRARGVAWPRRRDARLGCRYGVRGQHAASRGVTRRSHARSAPGNGDGGEDGRAVWQLLTLSGHLSRFGFFRVSV